VSARLHNSNGLQDVDSDDTQEGTAETTNGLTEVNSNNAGNHRDTHVIYNSEEIQKFSADFALECSREILVSLMSQDIMMQHVEELVTLPTTLNQKLDAAAMIPRIRYLVPIALQSTFNNLYEVRQQGIEWRALEPSSGLDFAVYDRIKAIVFQYQENRVSSAIVTTNRKTVLGLVSIFDALWRASELAQLHEKDRVLRKEAELLQDILTHDVKNYVQVVRLSAELISEKVPPQDNEIRPLMSDLVNSVDKTIDLLDNARKLGKIISKENPELIPTDVSLVMRSSLDLIRRTVSKSVSIAFEDADENKTSDGDHHPFLVYADGMLGEVFVNLFSNSVKYTESDEVRLSIKIEDGGNAILNNAISNSAHLLKSNQEETESYWKISVSDRGIGIPDNMKEQIFSRYLSSARGSGLGLSIVHALVVDRYRGKIRVINRVPGDYKQGLTVEILLHKAA
jgi:signal transduction histidine kinase